MQAFMRIGWVKFQSCTEGLKPSVRAHPPANYSPHQCKPDAFGPLPLDTADLQAFGPLESQPFKPAQLHNKSVRPLTLEMQTSKLKLAT